MQRDAQTWWNLPVTVAAHHWGLGGGIQIASAIFIFYIVACDMAHTYYVTTQNLLFLDVASHQRRLARSSASVLPMRHSQEGGEPGANGQECRESSRFQKWRRVGLGLAARFLQHSIRDAILPIALCPTMTSVLAVDTPLDVMFCGTIMLVVLQLDSLQMNSLLTQAQQMEIATQFSVVVTAAQEQRLRMELSIAFWSAW